MYTCPAQHRVLASRADGRQWRHASGEGASSSATRAGSSTHLSMPSRLSMCSAVASGSVGGIPGAQETPDQGGCQRWVGVDRPRPCPAICSQRLRLDCETPPRRAVEPPPSTSTSKTCARPSSTHSLLLFCLPANLPTRHILFSCFSFRHFRTSARRPSPDSYYCRHFPSAPTPQNPLCTQTLPQGADPSAPILRA